MPGKSIGIEAGSRRALVLLRNRRRRRRSRWSGGGLAVGDGRRQEGAAPDGFESLWGCIHLSLLLVQSVVAPHTSAGSRAADQSICCRRGELPRISLTR